MYVDESGDPGTHPLSSPHFILSGLVVSQNDWDKYLMRLKDFRKYLKEKYGLNQRTEIHAAELIRIQKLDEYKKIKKKDRLNIIKDYCSEIPVIFDTAKIINICIKISEHPKQDIFHLAWSRLLQQYDIFLKNDTTDKGIIVSDDTDSLKLMSLQRSMRKQGSISTPGKSLIHDRIHNIIEDTFTKSSHHSYFVQSADLIAHILYRMEYPKGSLKKHAVEHQFKKLEPILYRQAGEPDPYGIVRK